MTNEQTPSCPFPILEIDGKWRVDLGELETPYIDCETREHAEAIARLRPFDYALMDQQPIDADLAKETLAALKYYGEDDRNSYRRIEHYLDNPPAGDN